MTRKERSYLLPELKPEDRKLLAGLPRKATLAGEIDFLRLRLLRMARQDRDDDKDNTPQLLRLLELLTRMVNVQGKLGGDDNHDMDELTRIVRERAEAAARSR